ncbi:MAG: hypothetical protein A2900_02310 [Candidatus Chisholmbacteria bacterium RIFCSPLOWO2_01_FULL_50_28]|uniref:Addiction module toxin RelE n=1 Tax=Candidatus Chisholmbacteria bacterium RIFCSPHIGHO2_01_FULL_52_32 TaxID=1797591 RepID=A0A1G1VTG6_9BACT|nr:MAG: hypothetical protein A2786_04435 [Candidatus Chisholmbacteria bacterium RIFCSPHIGHO2_01_FULL_52_32]OGY19917.1 MAG: hypothetical protein A2900_02310 [Candidatus Chisholmbacteria bacterium RIFCSPLOWO2_01_FULL_50_28]
MSRYKIYLTTRAEKDFKKLSPQVKERIKTETLRSETSRYPQQFKSLVGNDISQYRLRIGDYRVLYDVYGDDKVVLILRIGHRKDIYR